ncbi:MAG: DinB family protein [Candidatus Bipolaricaulota bacterium]|nr:MAG: DinB family protein [Candidatus Bipolaricaulota bacterium]
MNWTELLTTQMKAAYASTEGLLAMVKDEDLAWKPPSGENWMTIGQLLRHITDACGMSSKGFVTGDWGLPEGFDPTEMTPDEMLPPAETLPTIESVAEAKRLLAEDKEIAFAMIGEAGEERLAKDMMSAPWDPRTLPLGLWLSQMVTHLESHKAQLFYYLKLQGVPVDTSHLWSG